MRPKVILAGVVVFTMAVIGYEYVPKLVTRAMNKFTGGAGDQHLMRSMMAQMGIPPLETLVPLTQYTMIAIGLTGMGVMVYGMLSMKKTKSISKFSQNSKQRLQDTNEMNQETLSMLKDSLANGEITYEQYQNILKRIES
ncbi:MAG: hypothetical protein ABI340_00965 [Nitrososphaera sp.]|jgi:uncharacterized membrane protein